MLKLDVPTTAVFSHPNHEIAVYALLTRLKARIIYLTDGGGEHRLRETREGLSRAGLLDRAVFLNYPESTLYNALLEKDVTFFLRLADRVLALFEETPPGQVFCDAVEYYNPVHDVTLPLVARWGLRNHIWEVPLVYQADAGGEIYHFQRAVPTLRALEETVTLSGEEVDKKGKAWEGIYAILRESMGPLIPDFRTAARYERVVKAQDPLRGVPLGARLRYEWRGDQLKNEGEVDRVITRQDHWLPVMRQVVAG